MNDKQKQLLFLSIKNPPTVGAVEGQGICCDSIST